MRNLTSGISAEVQDSTKVTRPELGTTSSATADSVQPLEPPSNLLAYNKLTRTTSEKLLALANAATFAAFSNSLPPPRKVAIKIPQATKKLLEDAQRKREEHLQTSTFLQWSVMKKKTIASLRQLKFSRNNK
jgi:hypothetical protein